MGLYASGTYLRYGFHALVRVTDSVMHYAAVLSKPTLETKHTVLLSTLQRKPTCMIRLGICIISLSLKIPACNAPAMIMQIS